MKALLILALTIGVAACTGPAKQDAADYRSVNSEAPQSNKPGIRISGNARFGVSKTF